METFEETGLDLPEERFIELEFLNVIDTKNNFHYVEMTLAWFVTQEEADKVYNKEPSEHVSIQWLDWEELIDLYENGNEEIFLSIRLLFDKYPKYKNYDILASMEPECT